MMSRKDALFSGNAKITAISPGYHAGDEMRNEMGTDKNEESLVLLYEEKMCIRARCPDRTLPRVYGRSWQ